MKREKAVSIVDALPPGERFFTKREMAAVMKISVRCLTDMMRRGEVAYLKINNRVVRFRLRDVNQRLDKTVLVRNGTEGGIYAWAGPGFDC